MRILGCLLVFSACHTSGGPDVPAVDAAQDGPPTDTVDAQPVRGMFLTWRADPPLPGTIADGIVVTSATFQLDHLQIVGDAGTDLRTTRSHYLLTWDAANKPMPENFPQAPVGVYSKIALVMMSGNLSENVYEIHGTWSDSGAPPRRFEIRDRATVSLSIDCNETLPAAGMTTIGIRLELANALNGINFKLLEEEEGQLELKDGPQLAEFRDRLKKAFKLDDG